MSESLGVALFLNYFVAWFFTIIAVYTGYKELVKLAAQEESPENSTKIRAYIHDFVWLMPSILTGVVGTLLFIICAIIFYGLRQESKKWREIARRYGQARKATRKS